MWSMLSSMLYISWNCSCRYQANKTMFCVGCTSALTHKLFSSSTGLIFCSFPKSLTVSNHSLSSCVHQAALVQTFLTPSLCPPALAIISYNHSRYGSKQYKEGTCWETTMWSFLRHFAPWNRKSLAGLLCFSLYSCWKMLWKKGKSEGQIFLGAGI